jgi:Spy/CpxP family protein refolding chaperone
MKSKTKLATYLTGAVCSLVLIAPLASAYPQFKADNLYQQVSTFLDGKAKLNRLSEKLGLTSEQKAKLEAILANTRPQLEQINQQRKANRQALRNLTQQDHYDEAEVTRLAEAQGDLTAQRVKLASQTKAEVFALLTPQQREKVQAMMEKKRLQKRQALAQ